MQDTCRISITMKISISPIVLLTIVAGLFYSCGETEKDTRKSDLSTIVFKRDTSEKKKSSEPVNPPIINIVDTLAVKRMVVVMKDSAATSERIGFKLSRIYDSILPAYFAKNKIKRAGPRMAWYKTSKAPFFFEAGIQVDKKPSKPGKNISFREIGGDSAVVVHYYGPYESTFQAYQAVKEWMTDYNKKPAGAPYETYITEPFDEKGKRVETYKLLTDIVFPRK